MSVVNKMLQALKPLVTISRKFPRSKVLMQQLRCLTFHKIDHLHDTMRSITISQLVGTDDGNNIGIIYGGTLLHMIDDAGSIIAGRYCNAPRDTNDPRAAHDYAVPTLARIESMDFEKPLNVGEVAKLFAEVKYTSRHSLAVEVDVHAEDILQGKAQLTNLARLWYVPVALGEQIKLTTVPPMTYKNNDDKMCGERSYKSVKNERNVDIVHSKFNIPEYSVDEVGTVAYSTTMMAKVIASSDLDVHNHCRGGVILEMLDDCGCIVAAKHCGSAVVTKGFDAINFKQRVRKGAVLTVAGRVTYTSQHTVEVQLLVDAEHPFEGQRDRFRVLDTYFLYVPMDENKNKITVPLLQVKTREEKLRFSGGKERYEIRKIRRSQDHSTMSPEEQICASSRKTVNPPVKPVDMGV